MKKIIPLLVLAIVGVLVACQQKEEPQKNDDAATFAQTAELNTVELTVVKNVKASDSIQWPGFLNDYLPNPDRKTLLKITATVKAGFDLKDFPGENGVRVDSLTKNVVVTLPKPVLSVDIKPEDIELSYEDVSWARKDFTAEERRLLVVQGQQSIQKDSEITAEALDLAKRNAERYFVAGLHNLGYKTVTVNFK